MPRSPVQGLCPHRQSSSSAPGRLKVRCEQRLQGGFLSFCARTHSCTLHVVSSRRRQKSQMLVVHVQLGSKSWCFQELLICCLFVNGSFSLSRGASGVWVPAPRLWVLGPRGSCCCVLMVLFKFCSCHLQSEPVFELAWSSLGSLSGRIASITKTNPPFLPVVIS